MNITTIEDFYEFLEKNTSDLYINDVSKILRDLYDREKNEVTKNKFRLELSACDFRFEDGETKPEFSSTHKDGSIHEYPSYLNFTQEDYLYIKQRAASVINDFLIARYNQILWNSPKERDQSNYLQCRTAIDAYLRIISSPECESEERKNSRDCLGIFKNGFSLSLGINYKVDEFKCLYKNWLFKDGVFNPDLKILLLRHLTELPQLKKDDFNGALELIKNYGLQKLATNQDVDWGKDIFKIGLKLSQKIQQETNSWNEYIGDSYSVMAENRKDDTNIVSLEFYRKAIMYYKTAGVKKKVTKTEKIYSELKSSLKLQTIEIQFGEEESEILNKYIIELSENILKLSPEEIYKNLIANSALFPRKDTVLGMGKDSESSFLRMVNTIVFDKNKNISKSGQETEKQTFFFNYRLSLNCQLPILHRIFHEGIKRGKLTYKNLVAYFLNKSWLGQQLTDTDTGGNLIHYNWISLIAPSLYYYFLQYEVQLKSDVRSGNYILSIDSLTLKLEGVFRDFARLNHISSTSMGREGVMREMHIEDLLAKEEMTELLGEDNLCFYQYFFTKNGENIRNNIAHTFYKYNDYSVIMIPILICAFLKIGRFKLKPLTDDEIKK